MPGQSGLDFRHLDRPEVSGQVADELLDHFEVLGIQHAGVPGFGGGRHLRRQWLPGEADPRT